MQEIETSTSGAPATGPAGMSLRLIASVVVLSLVGGFFGGYVGVLRGFGQRAAIGAKDGISEQKIVLKEDSAVVDVVKKASPAVVSIIISKDLSKLPGYGVDPFGGMDPFAPLFGFNFRGQKTPQQPDVQKIGAGSGFLVTADGIILTNKHVVSDASASYTVLMNDRKSFDAKVLTLDPINDLALLKIDIRNAPTLQLADSTTLQIGEKVIAIGNSLGQYQNTVTAGVVSGIGRSITAGDQDGSEQLEGVIQTDAAINPGNSGGPLLNVAGQVIGINTAIDREGQSVGFAIPSSDAKKALDSFQKTGKITRPFLGVRYIMLSEALAKKAKASQDVWCSRCARRSIDRFGCGTRWSS
jgi:serine protease Do